MMPLKKKDINVTTSMVNDDIAQAVSTVLSPFNTSITQNPKSLLKESVSEIKDAIFKLDRYEEQQGVLKFNIPTNHQPKEQATIIDQQNNHHQVPLTHLSQELKKHKNIDRIIIEEVKFDTLRRTQLQFDQSEERPEQKILTTTTRGSIDVSSNQTRSFNAKKVEFVRIPQKKNRIATLYYKSTQHNELFQLGQKYYHDIEHDVKSFAFAHISNSSKIAQQRTILGLSAFLSYHFKMTSIIFTTQLPSSYYQQKVTTEVATLPINHDFEIPCYRLDDLIIIEFSQLKDILDVLGVEQFDKLITHLTAEHILFWDLPETQDMDRQVELFFPITKNIKNFTLLVRKNFDKTKQLQKLNSYFHKYDIPCKGIIMNDQTTEEGISNECGT